MLVADAYKILGLRNNASRTEARRAYRKLALKYHPDHNMNSAEAEEKFKDIALAYNCIKEQMAEYYVVLGVHRRATNSEIRAAFQRKMDEYSPKAAAGDAESESTLAVVKKAFIILTGEGEQGAVSEDSW